MECSNLMYTNVENVSHNIMLSALKTSEKIV